MISDEELAYRAYGQATNFKNFQGKAMPEWADLPESIQLAWFSAARAVHSRTRAKYEVTMDGPTPREGP